VSLGVKGKANRKPAQEAWHRLMADGPKHRPKAKAEALTVRGMVDAFLSDITARLKPATVARYRYDMEALCRSFGKMPAEQVTGPALTRWLNGGAGSSTYKAITLRSVSACFGWAVRNDMLADNPVRKVPKPKSRSRGVEAVISEADHTKLIAAATADFRLVLHVLWTTGCRPGEVGGISSDTFDPDTGVIRLTEHKTDHTGRPRLIFVPPAICAMLRVQIVRYPAGPLLRSRKSVPWSGKSITHAMGRLKRKAGVKATAYGYRHTFATDALAGGVPDAQVAALLGHSGTAMLHRHYSHLTSRTDVLRAAAAKVR